MNEYAASFPGNGNMSGSGNPDARSSSITTRGGKQHAGSDSYAQELALAHELVQTMAAPAALVGSDGSLLAWSEPLVELPVFDPERFREGEPASRALMVKEDLKPMLARRETFTLPLQATGVDSWLALCFQPLASDGRNTWLVRLRASEGIFRDHQDLLEFLSSLSPGSNPYGAALEAVEVRSTRLMQSERMAGIGQLAAGVAHEINNPMGYVSSNLQSMREYVNSILFVLDSLEEARNLAGDDAPVIRHLDEVRTRADLDFIRGDLASLVEESIQGVDRVREIVQSLKEFSHAGVESFEFHDIHSLIESTLRVAHNEIKYRARVVRDFGDVPPVECIASQLNQVILNLLVNAAQAIETDGIITLRTGVEGDRAWIEVEDTGVGMEPEQLRRLFEPFYTTKSAGQGTGLGLPLSSAIIERHHGDITVTSESGTGSVFRVRLPLQQPEPL